MHRSKSAGAGVLLSLGLLSIFLYSASAAPAVELPPLARNQIAELQAEKAARTPAERKLDSQLIYALRQQRLGRVAPGLPRFTADLRILPGNRVLVDMDAEVSAALMESIANAGGRAVASHASHRFIRAEVPLEAVELLAMHNEVRSIRPADEATSNALKPTLGDVAHGADLVRSSFLVDGAGIKVGVLSDSAHYLSDLQNAGLLPPVTVLPGQFGIGSGEGTAMLQIVHQVAPGASLYFATAFLGIPSFAQNIRDLRAAGCQIIVDDVLYFRESPFQDGPIAQAVRDICADGALYFSCAANGGNFNDGTSTTWRGDFVDGGETGIGRGGRVHLFGTNSFNTVLNNPISSLIRADLFWADPLGQSTNDYDLYVLDSSNVVIRSSSNIQDGDDDPYEMVSTVRTGERLVIVKASGEARFLHVTTYGGRLQFSTSGSVRGHNAANVPNAFSVAATRAPLPEALFTGGAANPVETFSCDGPRRIFFTPEGQPITPGNFTSTGGVLVNKPEITAADGVSTAVPGFSYFLGTSAAAPNAAAIAALLWSFDSSVAPEEISWALTTTTFDIEAPGFDNDSGWGIVMAVSAADVLPGATANLVVQNVSVTDANGNGSMDVNECADLTIVLKNTVSSLGDTATGIEAVLTTAVPGVRIDPEPRHYPDLDGQVSGTNSVAFRISTTPDFICGRDIDCVLLVSTAEGKLFQRQVVLNSAAGPIGGGMQTVSTDVPVPIPDLGFVESTITVQGVAQQIADVVVSLFVAHTYDSDLTLSLIGPDGTSVQLVANSGGSGQNYGASCAQPVVFADAAANSILQGTAPFVGTFRPQEPLTMFRGKAGSEVNGVWKLRAADGAALDVGTILCWSLNLIPYTCNDGGGECLTPPVITGQPQNVTTTNGETVQLDVAVTGTPPLFYQWVHGETQIPGETAPSLVLENLQPSQAGAYFVIVSNYYGSVASLPAQVVLLAPPYILAGPTDQVVTNGGTVAFSVVVGGSEPLFYQWFFNETNLLSDATTAELVLSNVNSAAVGTYGVTVSNSLGSAASTLATLTILDPPAITFEPQDVAVTNGDNAQFSVLAAGTEPLGYQWYFNGTNLLNGATDSTLNLLTVSPSEAGGYSVEVSNEVAVVWSREAQLTVLRAPVIVQSPVDQVATNGDTVTFNVLVTGSEPLVYRWYFNETNLLDDASTADLILTNVSSAAVGTYSVTVSNLMGFAASLPATLEVLDPPVINSEPQDVAVGIGDNVQFSVSATGTEPLSYQWYFNGTNLLAGATGPTLDLPTVSSSEAGLYSVEVSNEVAVVWSRQAQLSVLSFPVIAQSPVDQVATNGDTVTFSVLVTGSEPLVYQWFFNETNLLNDATTAELVLSNVTSSAAGTYTVTVSNLLGSASSIPATLSILVFPTIVAEPQDTIVTNDHNAQFSVIAAGTEPLTYRWYFNSSNLLAGSTSPTLDLVGVSLNQAGLYSVEVSNEVAVVWSRQAQLTVLSEPVIVQDPVNQIVTNGATVMFSVLATGSEPLIYRWFFNETNLLGDVITAELVLTNVSPTATGSYAVTVSNLMGFAASLPASLLVLDPPTITFEPQDVAVTNGDNAQFTVVAMGTEPLTYQWYFNGSNLLADATNSTLNVLSVNPPDAGFYSVEVSNEVAVVWSRQARLTVLKKRQNLAPMIVENPSSLVATNGDNVTFTVVASGSEPLTYQWFFNETNLLTGAVTESLLLTNVTSDVMGTYVVTVSNYVSVASSSPATLVVLDPPVISSEPQDRVVATGDDVQFTVGAVGTEPLAYQWYFNGSNLLSGATGPTLDLLGLSLGDSGFYSVAVSNEVAMVWSRQAELAVLDSPAITQSPVDQVVTNGDAVTFSVVVDGSEPLVYQWYFAPAGEMTGVVGPVPEGLFDATNRITGATNAELVLDAVAAVATGTYAVTVSNSVGGANSLPAALVVLSLPVILSQPQSVTMLSGGSTQFSVLATGIPSPAYQWFFNQTNLLSGATENLLTITDAQPEQVGSYVAVVSNAVGVVISSPAFLAIAHAPAILASPQNMTIRADGTATFAVLAEGTAPLSYAWMQNETNFIATTSTGELSLTNVTGFHTGQYAAVVSNVVGSAISQSATLRVLVPPDIVLFDQDELGPLTITFSTWPGLRYTVEYKETLRDTTWIRLSGAEKMLGTGQTVTVYDLNPTGTSRYYHVLVE